MAIYDPADDNLQEAQDLIDLVLDQMLADIQAGDFTAIQELLLAVPEANLKAFLSEGPY